MNWCPSFVRVVFVSFCTTGITCVRTTGTTFVRITFVQSVGTPGFCTTVARTQFVVDHRIERIQFTPVSVQLVSTPGVIFLLDSNDDLGEQSDNLLLRLEVFLTQVIEKSSLLVVAHGIEPKDQSDQAKMKR